MKGRGLLETRLSFFLLIMKGKATKLNKGVRETKVVPKNTNKGKRTGKQERPNKKQVKKGDNLTKREGGNCSNNANEDTLQCREEELCRGGGRLELWEKEMMAGPQR